MKRIFVVLMVVGLGLVSPIKLKAADPDPAPSTENGPDLSLAHPRRLERIREQLEVTKDDEWRIISERVAKVMEAEHDLGPSARPGKRSKSAALGGDEPISKKGKKKATTVAHSDTEVLQKVIDEKPSSNDLKEALMKFRDGRRQKLAKLTQAQEDLRKVLTLKQEAQAVVLGLLD